MIIKKELLKKLYLNYFAFKLNLNEFRSPLNINEKTILLIYVYKIFCKNTDDILQNERSAALQIYFILIETEEIEEKLFSNIRFWLGDYPWIMNNLSDEKMNEEELRFFSNKIFNQGYKHNNFIFFEKQNELLKCFGDNNQKYFLVSAPTSFGKTKIIVDNINVNSCIIVPTIALQNEIGNLLRNQERFFNKIITKSNFNYSKNFLYVFTQEKLLNFLSFNKKNNIKFDTLVVDEAHQMLSNTTRSFLLEGLIKKIYESNMLNKIIFLTPKVKKDFFKEYVPKHIYDNLQFIKLDNFFITDRVYFFKEKNEIYFWNFFKNQKEKLIDYEINDIKSLVDKLDDKPIIYTSKQKVKENAILLSKSSNNTIENNAKNLIDYFKENIGEKYFINNFLKKDIFIHTGSIDKTGRLLMENKFKNSNNFTLIANQTIISGINMNCKNLIVETSRTDGKNFKKGNFLNLVGRVGRYNTQHNSYLGTVFCLKSSNKICDEILRSKKFLNLEDYQIHTKDDLNKLREKDQDLSYDDKVLNKMYENKIQGFKNFIPIFLKNDNHDFYKQKIIEDKDFFQNYFKGTKTQENIKSFIEKIINIFEWSNSFNPFLASSNNDDSWKTILILYYTNYINRKTIKQMVKEFLEYSKKNSKQYYVIENKKGKHLTTRQYNDYKKEKNRAANEDDIIETCIETNISWIEHKLNSFIYFVVFTLQEEGIDIDIEEDIDGFKNNLEKELLSLGIERHLIHEIVEKYGRENFTIEQLIKNIDENDKGYIKDIFVSCGIIQT